MRDHDEMPTVCSEVMRDGTVVARGRRSRSGAAGVAPAAAGCDARGDEEASGETRDSGREENEEEEEEEEEEESWAAPAEVLAEAAKLLVLGAEPVATGAAPAAEGGAPAVAGVVVDVVVWMMTVLERTVLTSSYSSTTTGRCDFDDTGTAEAIVVVDAISKAAAGCLAKFVVVERE